MSPCRSVCRRHTRKRSVIEPRRVSTDIGCMSDRTPSISALNARSREVFRQLVETYLSTGAPVGSRTLSREISEKLSAATVRNVMQDLEIIGLLGSPHASAGRVPTQLGLRLFVDGLLEVGDVSDPDRAFLDGLTDSESEPIQARLDHVGQVLSGLTQGASLVLAPKHEADLQHIDFISLAPDRALVVLVFADGHVENRIFTPAPGQTPSSMREAANFLNGIATGRPLSEIARHIAQEIDKRRAEIDSAAAALIETGIAQWVDRGAQTERLIVRGRGNLLSDPSDLDELERIRSLFDDLERKRDIAEFLDRTEDGEGVRIFIGSENKLFSLSGSSLVVSPYMNADREIIGAVGVIGPTRLNYGRIVPIVDYTAQLIGRVLSGRGV